MGGRRMLKLWLLALALTMGSGCAHPISKFLREQAANGPRFAQVLENPDAYVGSVVIWGGRIIETINEPKGSEILILETPLGYIEKPKGPEYSQGRFIGKTSRFLDPVIYKKGGKITVAGKIIGKEMRTLGKTAYTYPVVEMEEYHLWEKESTVYSPPYYWWDWQGWYSPLYEPWGPYDYDLDDLDRD